MNTEKTERLKRIRGLEEQRLVTKTGELKALQHTLHEQQTQLARFEKLRDENLNAATTNVVEINELEQIRVWCERAEKTIQNYKLEIQQTETKRDKALSQIVQIRATIKGWDILVEKLQAEDEAERVREGTIDADDDFLRKLNRRA